jgi:hypothetical protein
MTIDIIQHVVGYARFTLQYFPLCQPNVTDDQNCSSLYAKIRGIFFFFRLIRVWQNGKCHYKVTLKIKSVYFFNRFFDISCKSLLFFIINTNLIHNNLTLTSRQGYVVLTSLKVNNKSYD